MTSGHTISVRALGTFGVAFNGRPVERWRAGKARHLLQFLLLHPNQTMSHDLLHDALWPSAPGPTSSSCLKVAVHGLRKTLSQAQISRNLENFGSYLRVCTCESGYKLETSNVWVDYSEFESLIDHAHRAQKSGDLHGAEELFAKAGELYEGDFLPGLPDDWAATQREWLRSRALFALGFLARRRLKQGDHLAVIDLGRRMLAIDSLYEEAYRMLISVHAELGQLAQVRRWYSLCAKRFRDELQVVPDNETRGLYEHALRGNHHVG